MKTVLIIDDMPDILDMLQLLLSETYKSLTATNREEALRHLETTSVDAIVLDINMPGANGYQLCSEIRNLERYATIPIIFISGQCESFSKVTCYKVGGDHFISKPIDIEELKAVLARMFEKHVPVQSTADEYGDLKVDTESRRVTVGTDRVELSNKEFLILVHLLKQREKLVTRESILDTVWGHGTSVSDRTIDTHISHLRKKIEASTCKIKSVYQAGYILSLD